MFGRSQWPFCRSASSDAFRANTARMDGAARRRARPALLGEPAAAATRRASATSARGKLLPRERVAQLLDPGTPFLEIGLFAAHGLYDGDDRRRPA